MDAKLYILVLICKNKFCGCYLYVIYLCNQTNIMDSNTQNSSDAATRDQTYSEKLLYWPGTIDRQNTVWIKEIADKCKHTWRPISFVFETQLLDSSGRVSIRQPDITHGKVYCVCMKCCSHTYIITGWAGYYLNSPDLLEEEYVAKNNK